MQHRRYRRAAIMGRISRINSKRRVQYLPHTMQRIMIILLVTLICASSWATAKKLVNHQSMKIAQPLAINTPLQNATMKNVLILFFLFETGNHWNEVASQRIRLFVCYVTASIQQHSLFDAPTTCYHRHHQIMRDHQVLALNREHFNGAKKVKCRHVYIFYKPERLLIYHRKISRLSEEWFLFFVKRIHKFYILKHGVCLLSQTFLFLRYSYYFFIVSFFLQFSVIFVLIELRFFLFFQTMSIKSICFTWKHLIYEYNF